MTNAQTGILAGFAVVFFLLAIALFVLDSPAIGSAMIAMGGSMLAISASQKKKNDG